jgi:hypothetical protein
MRFFGWFILVLLTLGVGSNAMAQAPSGPVLELEKAVHDGGKVREGEHVTHAFKIMNRGKGILEIHNVEPG